MTNVELTTQAKVSGIISTQAIMNISEGADSTCWAKQCDYLQNEKTLFSILAQWCFCKIFLLMTVNRLSLTRRQQFF